MWNISNPKKCPKRLNSMKFSFFLNATRTTTLKWNLKEPMMIKTFGTFNTSSGLIITSSFWETNLFWSNKVVWVIFTHFSKVFFSSFSKIKKNVYFSKIQDVMQYKSFSFQHRMKMKPDLESWRKTIKKEKITEKKHFSENPLISCVICFFPDALKIYI